ncbi:hypothetical protein [Priestia aryabhattai]|uniref:hypothetical protein n=1 Tax=Priestia aryabhattai TaxID=412384 RepID=UPI002175443C|nr:hypothetical protein [Priestia aryabhattai]
MKDIKKYLEGRISHAKKRASLLKESHGKTPNETHNYFGGQSLGYWEGRLSAYSNVLDEIEELEKED